MNKSFTTNFIALALTLSGYFIDQQLMFIIGVFALSGGLTNWLAVHMLFEKIPGLYGSGVIALHFKEFKDGIRELVMSQFFSDDNIDRFLSSNQSAGRNLHLAPVIEKLDLSPIFDTLVKTIMGSSFGGMLSMVGGEEALKPLRQPFLDNLRSAIVDMTNSDEFSALLVEELEQPDVLADLKGKVQNIISQRLEELTPQMVKTIIEDMIRRHLGWLVVWGGLFGGLIGLLSHLLGLI